MQSDDVKRLPGTHAQPPTLADGKTGDPCVFAQHSPLQVDDGAAFLAVAGHAADESPVIAVGDKAEILTLGLAGIGQTV